MRVFVAGATGAIGQPILRALVARGHAVVGMTHTASGAERVRALGAVPVIVDALDAAAVARAMADTRPEAVIDELTALPRRFSPDAMRAAAPQDTRVRIEGGAHVITAAARVGARRYVVASSGFWSAPGLGLADEDTPLAVDVDAPGVKASAETFAALEARAAALADMEAVVLRYGFFYGPGTWYTRDGDIAEIARRGDMPIAGTGAGVASFVHVDDAAAATVAALDGPPGTYNIVDGDPVRASVWMPAFARWAGGPPPSWISAEDAERAFGLDYVFRCTRLRGASNAKARVMLDFTPRPLEWL